MYSFGGSIEDQIALKLHFNELTPPEQVRAALQYFKIIIDGSVRTSPPELKGLLMLMFSLLVHDADASITKWLINYESSIAFFFKQNMQRFDRFEFQPYFDKLKGKTAAKAYAVPLYDSRNFENMRPVNMQQYGILEKGGVAPSRERVVAKDYYGMTDEQQKAQTEIIQKLSNVQKQIQALIATQGLSRELLAKDVRQVQEFCIPALQMKYNVQAVSALEQALFEGVDQALIAVFDSLRMPFQQQVRFCEVLAQKCAQRSVVKAA